MNKQSGVTLVSMMVGVLIGIFVTGAAIKIYLDSKSSFQLRSVVAGVSENQRFALDDMRRVLIMTGRGIKGMEDNNPDKRAFLPLTNTYSTALTKGKEVMYDSGASTTESDVIAIRYRRGPSCGEYQDVAVTDRPSMVRFYVNNQNELICELTTYISGVKKSTTYVIADNVLLMKALYGVDETEDKYADRYVSASEINNTNFTVPPGYNSVWSRVKSIRIAMILKSDQEIPDAYRKSSPGTINILGLNYTEPDTAHLYRTASTTLVFRNLNPTVQRQ